MLAVDICVMSYNLRTSIFLFCSFISQRPFVNNSTKYHQVFIAGVDTLIWQSFASVIIPGITINRICALSLYTMKHATKLPAKTRKWLTTGIGLACIPFIIKPIDAFVDFVMDETFRKAVGTGKWQP
jgi:fission process protein 1